jgi:hypothetical protein
VKRGTYALVYGAGVRGILDIIRREYRAQTGQEMTEARAGRFLSHPLVSELLSARDAELAQIRADGQLTDVYGRTLAQGRMTFGDGIRRTVHGASAAPSLLAQRAQARELWLLAPAIELAEIEAETARPRWMLAAWQHDGFSVRFREPKRRAGILREIRAAVNQRAQASGYPTGLEVKWDPMAG